MLSSMIHYLSITPSATCNTCPPYDPSLVYPIPPPPSTLNPSVCFSESIVYHASLPLLITPLFIPFFPYRSSLFLFSIDERNHMIIIFLCPTYFTLSYLLQYHPCCSKRSELILSDRWGIFHCIYRPHLLNPDICWRATRLLQWFSYCGQCCCERCGACGPSLHYVCIFGVNTQ